MRSVPLLATQGRGRPKKYGRPARAVTVTLPEDILATLNAADTDLGRAIVKFVERRGICARKNLKLLDLAFRHNEVRVSIAVANLQERGICPNNVALNGCPIQQR